MSKAFGSHKPAQDHLSPLLAPGLDIVFVGTDPGRESLRLRQYYADSSNSFFANLHAVGLTPHELSPADFEQLIDHGIGLDDVYDDPSGLRARIEHVVPKAVCFNSKGALERAVNRRIRSD